MALTDIQVRVKTILGIGDEKDAVIEQLIATMTSAVNLYCGIDTLPIELEFVVVETTISRFNRLGSEGLTQEQIDSLSTSFQTDIFAPYKQYMDAYKKKSNKVIFL